MRIAGWICERKRNLVRWTWCWRDDGRDSQVVEKAAGLAEVQKLMGRKDHFAAAVGEGALHSIAHTAILKEREAIDG